MMVIKPATIEDIEDIADIERQCFSRPWSYDSIMSEFDSADGILITAKDGHRLLGFAMLHLFFDEAELYNIAVAPTSRRCGVGRALISRVISESAKRDIRRIVLEVRKSNAGARALYKSCGFAVCGERRDYYDDPKENAILMDIDIGSVTEELH
jgi:ribosomal-protein-alanine N-acetyltransferase